MQPIDGYFLYTLGSIADLRSMIDGVPVSDYALPFLRIVAVLDGFKSNEQNKRNLPDAVMRAEGLWNLIGSLM